MKIAINSYIKLDVLKKKIDDIKDIESLMKNEQDLKNLIDPPYNFLFTRVSSMEENGLKILQEIQSDLLSMFLDMPNMSNVQKQSIMTMRGHLSLLVNSILEKEHRNKSQ